MELSFQPLSLPAERELLLDFLSSNPWPFHSGSRVNPEDLLRHIDTSGFSHSGTQSCSKQPKK